jgi:hypothetical protein
MNLIGINDRQTSTTTLMVPYALALDELINAMGRSLHREVRTELKLVPLSAT